MKVKCTKEIKMMQYSGTPESLSQEGLNDFNNKKWISLDDLEDWIANISDKEAFNDWQIRKTTILNEIQECRKR